MNLPFFNRFNKKVIALYYLVLILRDEKAQAVIFEEIEGVVKIIGQKEEHFSTSIDEVSSEELLGKLDKAISTAESTLPENIQTQKTIFGVKDSWTENDQIKKEDLAKLKKASEELGLVPIGFLVISQAIAHLLQKEEGVPVSAILTEINKKSLTVTLLRAGKSIETKSSAIHESIPFTVDTLLKHFNIPEILPSRIIIFNGSEDFSQEFISHTWSKSLPFLHLPQITNLPHGFDAKAVLFGAATQMGFEVLEKDIPKEPQLAEIIAEEKAEVINVESSFEEKKSYKNLGASDFGFAKDIDVAKMEFKEPLEEIEENSTNNVLENFTDVELPNQANSSEAPTAPSRQLSNIFTLIKNTSSAVFGLALRSIRKINIGQIKSNIPSGKFKIIIPIIVLAIAFVAAYYLFIKAVITITVDPKITQQNQSVLFSTTKATDPNANIIKGTFVSVSEDGSVSTPATGKKNIGTNAKGTVTIFSSLTQDKTLAQGTVLKSSNGLEFTLDSSVTVSAVASHSADETVTPEKVSANVTASDLGKESNLPSGTKFTVDSFDSADIIAKNDNPFSGGTKTTVTVASVADSTKLEKDIIAQLEQNARNDLEKEIDQNTVLLHAFIKKSLGNKSLNVKIGDETNQVTLTGTVDYQGISYNKTDLISFSKSLLDKNVAANQTVDYNNIQATVINIKNKNDDEFDANLNIKTLLLPKIDQTKLIKDVLGKPFKVAQDLIYKLPQIANVEIKLSPNLPLLPSSLPNVERNIKILITQ